jgi:TetR/AcrR family transcriptional repressor of nem operon
MSADTRTRLLDAAMALIRRDGLSATSVADLCAAAGVTKGAFFHHFATKEDLAVAAAEHWNSTTGALFDAAPYRRHADPLDRVLGYVAQRREWLAGPLPEVTCLAGTMVQEAYVTAPAIRDAARDSILGHAATVTRDIEAARALHAPDAPWDAQGLSLHIQAVLQGAFILAKATGDTAVAQGSLDHLAAYLRHLFHADRPQKDRT